MNSPHLNNLFKSPNGQTPNFSAILSPSNTIFSPTSTILSPSGTILSPSGTIFSPSGSILSPATGKRRFLKSPRGLLAKKHGKVKDSYDHFGFLKEETGYSDIYTESYVRPEGEQLKLWNQILSEWDQWQDGRLQYLVYCEGLPSELRTRIWSKFLKVDKFKLNHPPGYFQSLVTREGEESNVEQIKLDLNRTFPSHKLFREGKGKEEMYNILKAYSIYNPKVGYCQGMSYVCAALLINKLTEEESFWMLVGIMDLFQENYTTTMTGILSSNDTFRDLLNILNPSISKHLEKLQAISVIFISRWFLTLFTDLKHWQTVLRLWDVIFFEGQASLIRISLAIVNCCEKQILQCKQFGELGSYLINIPKETIQPKYLLPALFAIDIEDLSKKLNNQKMQNNSQKEIISSPQPTTFSQLSQFWADYNQTPQKFVSKPQNDRSVFSFSLGFLTNKLGYLALSDSEPFTPDKKRLGGSYLSENPQKKTKSIRITSFFSK